MAAILTSAAILLACAACAPAGGAPETDAAQVPTTQSDNDSGSGDTTEPSPGAPSAPPDDASAQDDSGSASAGALCNDLEGGNINGDSDEDMAAGIALWHTMVNDAPSDIKAAVQLVSGGLDTAATGDPSVAQSDAWGQALQQVAAWEIANC